MIETRQLTREETETLLYEAPDSETEKLSQMCYKLKMGAYDFFNRYSFEKLGLLSDGRPIYLAGLMKNEDDVFELWTVVNSNVTDQKSLYKYSRNYLYDKLPKYKEIYATVDKSFDKNRKWMEKMGFTKCSENEHDITYKITLEQLEQKPPHKNKENENGMRRQNTDLHCASCT